MGSFGRILRPVFDPGLVAHNGLLNNLVAYWPFNEAAGANNALDLHTNGLTLTQIASPGSVSGKINMARSLNGSSAAFERESWLSLSGAPAMSASAWIKPSSNATTQTLLSLWTPTNQFLVYLSDARTGLPNSGKVQIFTSNSTYATSANTALVFDGAWHHLATRYNGNLSGELRITVLVDGVESPMTVTGALPATLAVGTPYLEIGRVARGANYFNGAIDEVGIWSRAISDTEFSLLYNSGAGLPYAAFTT